MMGYGVFEFRLFIQSPITIKTEFDFCHGGCYIYSGGTSKHPDIFNISSNSLNLQQIGEFQSKVKQPVSGGVQSVSFHATIKHDPMKCMEGYITLVLFLGSVHAYTFGGQIHFPPVILSPFLYPCGTT